MNKDKVKNHIEHLKQKHYLLELEIEDCYNHFDPDEKVRELKAKKLVLKQEIDRLEKEIA